MAILFLIGAILTWFGGWAMLKYLNQETDSAIHLYGGLIVACAGLGMVGNVIFG